MGTFLLSRQGDIFIESRHRDNGPTRRTELPVGGLGLFTILSLQDGLILFYYIQNISRFC